MARSAILAPLNVQDSPIVEDKACLLIGTTVDLAAFPYRLSDRRRGRE